MNSPARIDPSVPRPRPVLLFGGTVLTMNDSGSVVHNAELLIDQGRIAALGRALTVRPGTRLLDVTGSLIIPGLVQGHIHLGQTFFRGLAEGRALMPWLQERIWPFEAAHDDESAYWCTLQGAAECLLSGTTTVQDIGIGPGARGYLQAMADSHLRGLAGKCLMDLGDGMPPALAEETEATLSETEALGDEFDGRHDGRLHYAINPRFILSCSDALWNGARQLAERRGWPIHTHALEHRHETDLVRAQKNGRDEIEYFDESGVLGTDLRIAHGVWLESHHYPRLGQERFAVVHCPSANLKLGSGIADVVGLRGAGIPVGLGCDGAACNNRLDAFEEIRLAALLQKMRHGPESFSGRDALRLATIEGARALGLDDKIGSLEEGKKADFVVLDTHHPELTAAPEADPHDLLAFGGSGTRVRHVFVEGEQLVDDGRLTHFDFDTVREQAGKARTALLQRAGVTL